MYIGIVVHARRCSCCVVRESNLSVGCNIGAQHIDESRVNIHRHTHARLVCVCALSACVCVLELAASAGLVDGCCG
jgi:hypothetical protein